MKKDDWKNFLMIIATLIVSIISLGTSNLFIQILFIIVFLLICYLAFSYLNTKSNIKRGFLILLCVAEIVILGISIFTDNGSFVDFCKRMKTFFVSPQEVTTGNVIVSDIDFESYFDDFNAKMEDFDQKVKNTNDNIEKLDNDLNFIANNLENIRFNDNIDEIEINSIVELIEKYSEEQSDSFPDLKTDIYSLELLYKMFISEESYYYCNILSAFEKFGINTEELNVDENTLFVWDIETLYILYNMQKKNLDNMCVDENAIGEAFLYNDYRVRMKKYSDTFDYGNWRRDYEEYTAVEVEEKFDNLIMKYYKKFVINFLVE